MASVKWIVSLGVSVLWLGLPIGSSHAELTLDSDLSVTGTFTDNLFFTGSNRQEDYGTFISAGVGLTHRSQNLVLTGFYRGTLQFWANNTDENFFANRANIYLDLPNLYKGLHVRFIESLNLTPFLQGFSFLGEPGQPLGARPVGDTSGISGATLNNQGLFTQRADAFQNFASVRLTYAATPRVSTSLGYDNRLLLFADDQFQDSISNFVTFGLGYATSARTQARVDYRFNVTDFKDGSVTTDSFISNGVTIGANHQYSQTLSLDGDAGVSVTDQTTQDVNFLGGVGMSWAYSPHGDFNFRFRQRIGTGGGLGATATLNSVFTGNATYQFTRRLSGVLGLGLARNDSLEGNEIDALTYNGHARLRLELLSWLYGNARYFYINQDNTGTLASDAQRHQVFVGLTAVQLPWTIVD